MNVDMNTDRTSKNMTTPETLYSCSEGTDGAISAQL